MSGHHDNERKRHHQEMVEEHWREERHRERRCNFIIVAVMFALFAVCFTWHQVRIWSDQEIVDASVPQKTVTLVFYGGKFGPGHYDLAYWHRDGKGNLVWGEFSVPENAQNILGNPTLSPTPVSQGMVLLGTNLSLRKATVSGGVEASASLSGGDVVKPIAGGESRRPEGMALSSSEPRRNPKRASLAGKAKAPPAHFFIGHYQNGVVTALFIRGGHIVPKSEFMDSVDVDGGGYPEYAK